MTNALLPAPAIEAKTPRVISHPNHRYVGWPTIAKLEDGRLMLVVSGGRDAHICPFGQLHMIQSFNDGESWTRPRVLVDGPLDDRDAGILQTTSGTIIATWFTSMAWKNRLDNEEFRETLLPTDRQAWSDFEKTLTEEIIEDHMGAWAIRSTDGGVTWSAPIDTVANSPHGPIKLASGALLYPGKMRKEAGYATNGSPFAPRIGASISHDDGQSWQWHGDIPAAPGHDVNNYHELHGVQAANDDIIVHIRNHNDDADNLHILQTVSSDSGKSWTTPESIGIWGYPCHLVRLKDDTLLTVYTHRQKPRSIRGSISRDNGQSWCEPFTIAEQDAGDFGYPATVELNDGGLYTIYYARRDDKFITAIKAVNWRLEA